MKTFVEIGACDFDTCLPLAKNGWAGVFVEPVKELADNLVEQTKKFPFAHIENSVISDYNGEIDFHISTGTDGNDWTRGISSVDSNNHKGCSIFDFNNGVNRHLLKETRKIKCRTLDNLLDFYNIKEIDFLKIDTEGHERNILETYSWNVRPSFIKLEHDHIDDIWMKNFLEQKGYIVYVEQHDIYAIG